MVRVIGFAGAIGSGKTTCAQYLVDKYGAQSRAFADPLKEVCQIIFSLSHEQLFGSLKETPDPRWDNLAPRQLFQFVGTELFRERFSELCPGIGDNIWVKSLQNWLEQQPEDAIISVGDVRFFNEMHMIHKLGGIVIHLSRNNTTVCGHLSGHLSERALTRSIFDFRIDNNGDLQDLYAKIDAIVSGYL